MPSSKYGLATQADVGPGAAFITAPTSLSLTSGSAKQLTSGATNGNWGTGVQAPSTNTVSIYIGSSSGTTSSAGYELAAGDNARIPVYDASALWCYTGSSGQTLNWFVV